MDILLSALVLPIVAGFILLTKTPKYRYVYENKSYDEIIINSLLCGVLLLLVTFVLRQLMVYFADILSIKGCNIIIFLCGFIEHVKILVNETLSFRSDQKSFSFNGYGIASVLLALMVWICCYVWKRIFPASYYDYDVKQRLSAKPNSLENLLLYSFQTFSPIMVNLKGRKVYMGLIMNFNGGASNLNERRFFRMLPIASGFRDEQELTFKLQNSYDWFELIKKLNFDEEEKGKLKKALSVSMVINVDEIVSATVWIPPVYEYFNNADGAEG